MNMSFCRVVLGSVIIIYSAICILMVGKSWNSAVWNSATKFLVNKITGLLGLGASDIKRPAAVKGQRLKEGKKEGREEGWPIS